MIKVHLTNSESVAPMRDNRSEACILATGFRRKSFEDLSATFREQDIYPTNGLITSVSGKAVADIMGMHTVVAIESRINKLAAAVRDVGSVDVVNSIVGESVVIAKTSRKEHELYYMAGMFINHREVIRALAENPHIDERTQLILINDIELGKDREIQMRLAHNPALSDTSMMKMIDESDDQFVLKGIARNAAFRSKSAHDDTVYAKICALLSTSPDPILRAVAIPGIKDPTALRQIAANNSVFIAPRDLEAVAGNSYTPDDVLEKLATKGFPALQPIFSIQVAERARLTLESKTHQSEIGFEGGSFY